MKTSILVAAVLAVLASVSPADAQIIRSYGLSAAITSSDVRGPDVVIPSVPDLSFDTQRRFGFGLAVFVEWSVVGPLSMVTELGTTQRGFQTEYEARDEQNRFLGTETIRERMDFLAFDAALKMRRHMAGVSPYLLAGPELRFSVGGEGSLTDVQSSTAYGFATGLGVEIPASTNVGLQAEIRYSVDVSNSLPDVPRDIYHNAFDLRMGVRF